MRAYKITFCLGDVYTKDKSQEEVLKVNTYTQALNALYLSHWGTPVFVIEINEVYMP